MLLPSALILLLSSTLILPLLLARLIAALLVLICHGWVRLGALITLLLMRSATIPMLPTPMMLPTSSTTISSMITTAIVRLELIRHNSGSTLQIDIHPPCILFRCILQAQFLTYLFDLWFDLLYVAR